MNKYNSTRVIIDANGAAIGSITLPVYQIGGAGAVSVAGDRVMRLRALPDELARVEAEIAHAYRMATFWAERYHRARGIVRRRKEWALHLEDYQREASRDYVREAWKSRRLMNENRDQFAALLDKRMEIARDGKN